MIAGHYRILVGTTGADLFQSPDGGVSWSRIRDTFPGESQVRTLASDPTSPHVLYADANNGIYRSAYGGATWVKLDSPMEGLSTWSIAVNPSDFRTLFVGTSLPFVFRSRDGGTSWQNLLVAMAQACAIGPPRVTALLVDPVDLGTVLAGVDIDGVYLSRNVGDTWSHVDAGIANPDIHGMAISLDAKKTVLVSTPREIFASHDGGTRVTEIWDVEKLSPGRQSATQAQLDERSRYTEDMLARTLVALKATAEG